MRVRLTRILTALSLLLSAGTAAIWVATWDRVEGVRYNTATQSWDICSTRGTIQVSQFATGWSELEIYDRWYTYSGPTGDDVVDPAVLGFRWNYTPYPNTIGNSLSTGEWFVQVPYWFILLPTAIMPALWLRAIMVRRRRRATARCVTCGYDLRSTPQRCPECGTVPA